jgi:hypothetical protein
MRKRAVVCQSNVFLISGGVFLGIGAGVSGGGFYLSKDLEKIKV